MELFQLLSNHGILYKILFHKLGEENGLNRGGFEKSNIFINILYIRKFYLYEEVFFSWNC